MVNLEDYLLSENDKCATVFGMMFCVGNQVPFTNTRSKTDFATIESFKRVSNGKIWFTGKNIRTQKSVWYPLHLSIELIHKMAYKEPEPIPLFNNALIGGIDLHTKEYSLHKIDGDYAQEWVNSFKPAPEWEIPIFFNEKSEGVYNIEKTLQDAVLQFKADCLFFLGQKATDDGIYAIALGVCKRFAQRTEYADVYKPTLENEK